ncbi:MAG: DUF1905 domain-containing protein [Spirosoma sp.]|nr:DUF1905 domain-containing protein [Spirosoma sp.]
MHTFTTLLQRFGLKGEKTGWTYIEIPDNISNELRPGQKTSFRVRGTLDAFAIDQVALVPVGKDKDVSSAFIMAINATMRRGLRKEAGAMVRVELDYDDSPMLLSADLMTCLTDDPAALDFFNSLPKGHQNYFSNWIESAKTDSTRTKRITQAVTGLNLSLGYGEMIRHFKKLR